MNATLRIYGMSKSCPAPSALRVAVLFCLFCSGAHAQAIFKWTDVDGKVHYGDRAAAPQASQALHVAAPPPVAPATTLPSLLLRPDPKTQSVPVDPALVGAACKGLIDKIAAVPAGQGLQSLIREFNNACPGIAYACVEYVSNPLNNQCNWVEKKDGNILSRKRYR